MKKIATVLTATLVAVSLLSGCGGKDGSASKDGKVEIQFF